MMSSNVPDSLWIFNLECVQNSIGTSGLKTLLDWVRSLKHFGKFLQSSFVGLWEVEIHDHDLDEIPANEDKIEPVT